MGKTPWSSKPASEINVNKSDSPGPELVREAFLLPSMANHKPLLQKTHTYTLRLKFNLLVSERPSENFNYCQQLKHPSRGKPSFLSLSSFFQYGDNFLKIHFNIKLREFFEACKYACMPPYTKYIT